MSRFFDPKHHKGLSRRAVLRGTLNGVAISLALPPLQAMFNIGGTAYACGGAIPLRFGLFYWGNGNRPEMWTPTGEGSGDDWSLSEELAPLASLKDEVCVVSGLSVKLPNEHPHTSGAAGLLTGAPLDESGETFSAPTLDQVIADEIGGDTIYSSLQTAATDCDGMSYNGPNSRNPPESDPYALYERIFGDTFREPGEEGVVNPKLGLRRSILDGVMDDIEGLQGELGAADQQRLEQHLDGVRELEQRLAKLEEDPPNLEACVRPAELTLDYSDIDGRPQISERSAIMSDLLAMALACDQTRVFGHYVNDPVDDTLFPGADAGHHDLTHNEAGDQPQVHAITIHCVEQLAYMLAAFKAIPEADATLLDNCLVMGCSEVSLGQTHSIDEMPIVLAGTACGLLKTNFHYRSYGQENASKLILTILQTMGLTQSEFGVDDAWTNEILSDILV